MYPSVMVNVYLLLKPGVPSGYYLEKDVEDIWSYVIKERVNATAESTHHESGKQDTKKFGMIRHFIPNKTQKHEKADRWIKWLHSK